ncbi:MAG: hypothetical protein EOP82_17100 [Variovorax sp.]|nr:MAG: hypothetical protein EOP82_17100 [Variovorax sp.]
MESDDTKTPAQLAEEAEQIGRDALMAAKGYAQESGQIGKDAAQSIRTSLEDAKETGKQAADTLAGLSGDAKDMAKDAVDTGRAYAQNAVNATGRKIRDFNGRMRDARESCLRTIAEQPVRSTLIAAAGGAALMALLLGLMRGERRS